MTPAQVAAIVREARRNSAALRAVTGYFDVLQAAHVRQLQALAGEKTTLMVILLTPPQPILSLGARAELVAGVAVVDYVVPADEGGLRQLLGEFLPEELIREEAADEQRTAELIRHVHQRQAG